MIRECRHNGQHQIVWWDHAPPYWRSMKILRVCVTRAKIDTLILQHVFPHCPMLAGQNL